MFFPADLRLDHPLLGSWYVGLPYLMFSRSSRIHYHSASSYYLM